MADSVQELYDELSQPFPAEYIDWRIGSTNPEKTKGKPLCYVDARAVMDRLDTVCGPDGWQNQYIFAGNLAVCKLGIRMPVTGNWIWKEDGAGATDVEGEKGMLSDALKRAAVRWGVGRYLYDIKSGWVELEPAGRSYKIKESEQKKLEELHEREASKSAWGGPTAVAAYRLLANVVKDTVTQSSDAATFRERHKGMIPQLRVGMRRHLEHLLDSAGTYSTKEAAE